MSNRSSERADAVTELPSDLEDRLADLDESELRAVVSYARTLLPETPPVEDLLEERPGEELLEVEDRDSYTKVVKTQSCVQGCEECPHGPFVYHVRVEKRPESDEGPSLHWTFVGPVQQ